jgi:rhamnulokinase
MKGVFAVIPHEEIFESTGIQFQKFNTLYQLFSEAGNSENAATLLLLPDLINFMLTGRAVAEYTNATTTRW